MDIKLIDRGSLGEVLMTGKLDVNSSEQAGEILQKLADRYNELTLNIKGLTYISSAGLRELKKLYLKMRGNGGELSVINASPNVMEVFELTGVAEMLNVK